jgi:AAA+ ATPase superfamily predicted ATPase
MLDLGMADGILENRVRPTFEQFVGYAFEDAARAYVTRLARNGALSFLPERIGSWWDQTGEIDVVAVSETESALLVGECKWSVNPIGINILQDLQKKASSLFPKRTWGNIEYFLFSKSGYTRAVIDAAAQDPKVHLVSVTDCLT